MGREVGFTGRLLWAKLAEDLDIIPAPDHGKIEGTWASGSLAACRCDLMTSDLMLTLRVAKLSHDREGQDLLPLSGSLQGGVAAGQSGCSRRGGCNTKSRGQ